MRPKATFLKNDSGIPFNAYLTKTEVDEEGDVLTQFFSIKLVNVYSS